MPDILIKDVSAEDKERLRVQAAMNGHSMQEELRDILHAGVNPAPQQSFYSALKDALSGLEEAGFELPKRQEPRAVVNFS